MSGGGGSGGRAFSAECRRRRGNDLVRAGMDNGGGRDAGASASISSWRGGISLMSTEEMESRGS